MSETAQSTLEVLTEIAQSLNNDETVTLDDDLKRDLGFPVDDDYDHKEPVVSGSNGADPVTHTVYDIDGYWMHTKTVQDKPRGTTTYVKHVGVPQFEPMGLDEDEFRETYTAFRQRGLDAGLDEDEVAPEYSEDIFAAADEYQRRTAEEDAFHVGEGVAAVTDGTRIWMEHAHASRFVDLDHYFDDLNENGKKAVKEAIRESTVYSAPRHITSDLIAEYAVEVTYDDEPLLSKTVDNISEHDMTGTTIYVADDDYGYSSDNSDYKTPESGCDAAVIDEQDDGTYVVCVGVYEDDRHCDITDDVAAYDDFDAALKRVAIELN